MNRISKLGFGMMRLPMNGTEIDLAKTQEMVDCYMAAGGNYFDTSYAYNGGKSEEAIRKTVVDHYPREQYYIATKMPAFIVKTKEEAEAMFDISLNRLGCGYFDFYLLHNLGNERTETFEKWDLWNFLLDKKKQGLIRHLGFSIHDTAEAVDEVLTKHPEAEFVQLQINYADWEDPIIQSRQCYEVCQKHNKPVIIMEPIKGGSLSNFPSPASDILTSLNPDASLSSWALRYALSLPNVITVLSGMSTLAQVEDNIQTMRLPALTETEQEAIAKTAAALDEMPRIPCTECQYCVKGCPKDIRIPAIFSAYNTKLVYQNEAGARTSFGWATGRHGLPSDCIACGQCEAACPQHISIIEQLKKAAQEFA